MIVVTSNWAIGDGTLAPAVEPSLGGLVAAVHRAVLRAGVRADGSYRPVDRLDVVLAGDTFDWLLSAEWLANHKPWHASAAARETLVRIAGGSTRLGWPVLRSLIHWARHGVNVPASRGGSWCVAVPTRVTILVGDRDREVERVCGNRWHSVSIGRCWDDGRVSIRHGHEADPVCSSCAADGSHQLDRPPTLAESVTVDLLARFAAGIAPEGRPFIRRLAAAGVMGVPGVIRAWRASSAAAMNQRASDAWRRSVDDWWRTAQRCVPAVEAEFDAVGALAGWFRAAVEEDSLVSLPVGLSRLACRRARGTAGAVFGHLEGEGIPMSAVGLGGAVRAVGCRNPQGWPTWDSIAVDAVAHAVVSVQPSGVTTAGGDRVVDAA
ncbi:MAG: hypothetical protein ACKO4Z_12060 [Planctomycetota bacterium]